MSKFTIPIETFNIIYKNKKEAELKGRKGDRLISPYDSIVEYTSRSKCNGNIKLKHNVDGTTYYSSFCNVENINVFPGMTIRKGSTIGNVGDTDVEYTILDDSNKKQELKSFFDDTLTPPITNTSDNNKSENKRKEIDSTYDKSSSPGSSLFDLIAKPALSPFEFIHGALNTKKSTVKEEVERIKNLMK